MKLSEGSLDRLYLVVEQAQWDWRDCLVAAGFGDDPTAHLGWLAGT